MKYFLKDLCLPLPNLEELLRLASSKHQVFLFHLRAQELQMKFGYFLLHFLYVELALLLIIRCLCLRPLLLFLRIGKHH